MLATRSEIKKCMSLVSYCVDELKSGYASRGLGIARCSAERTNSLKLTVKKKGIKMEVKK